jgi:hypothetical protein
VAHRDSSWLQQVVRGQIAAAVALQACLEETNDKVGCSGHYGAALAAVDARYSAHKIVWYSLVAAAPLAVLCMIAAKLGYGRVR